MIVLAVGDPTEVPMSTSALIWWHGLLFAENKVFQRSLFTLSV